MQCIKNSFTDPASLNNETCIPVTLVVRMADQASASGLQRFSHAIIGGESGLETCPSGDEDLLDVISII